MCICLSTWLQALLVEGSGVDRMLSLLLGWPMYCGQCTVMPRRVVYLATSVWPPAHPAAGSRGAGACRARGSPAFLVDVGRPRWPGAAAGRRARCQFWKCTQAGLGLQVILNTMGVFVLAQNEADIPRQPLSFNEESTAKQWPNSSFRSKTGQKRRTRAPSDWRYANPR